MARRGMSLHRKVVRGFDALRTACESCIYVSDVLSDFGFSNRQLAPVLKYLRLRGDLAASRPSRLHGLSGLYCRSFVFADDRQEIVFANGLYVTLEFFCF